MAWVDRSYFVTRRRYRQAGVVGSILAVALAASYVAPNVHGAEEAIVATAGWGVLGPAVLLALAAVVPWTLANFGWRLHRRRWLVEA
jgi:hypothetical protein